MNEVVTGTQPNRSDKKVTPAFPIPTVWEGRGNGRIVFEQYIGTTSDVYKMIPGMYGLIRDCLGGARSGWRILPNPDLGYILYRGVKAALVSVRFTASRKIGRDLVPEEGQRIEFTFVRRRSANLQGVDSVYLMMELINVEDAGITTCDLTKDPDLHVYILHNFEQLERSL